MGSSTRRNSRLPLLLAALGVSGAAGLAQAQQAVSLDKCDDPTITLKSEKNATFNLRGKATELGKVDIVGCGARIRANNARTTSADFEDSSWTFEGDVRIDIDNEQGMLTSDKAVVQFRDNQIQQATITGSPAEFEHTRAGTTTKGSAGRIVYELTSQKVSLTDNAWVSDGGRMDVKAASLGYNLRTQDLDVAGKGSGRPYTLTIDPRLAKKKSGDKPDEKDGADKPPAKQDTPPNGGTPRPQ